MSLRPEQDVTRLERLLEQRTRELERLEHEVRELFDASPDGYVTVDARGRIEEVNRGAVRLTGCDAQDIVGRRVLAFLDAPGRRVVRDALGRLRDQARLDDLELRLRRRDGHSIDVLANVIGLQDESGRVVGARAVLRDISHRALLERHLAQVDRLAVTGQLAAGIAHEINNPLQAILINLSLVQDLLPRDFPERDSFERVVAGVRRVKQIATDLLDLHRGTEAEPGPVDVNAVVTEALGLVRTTLKHRALTARAELADPLPPARAVARHVYQAMLNLLLNAMDVLPPGGRIVVRTRYLPALGQVELAVVDNGPGIAPELQEHIFDPFLTGERQGSGLGLFVTASLVRQHGGRIRVESVPGQGATFRVTLPVDDGSGVPAR